MLGGTGALGSGLAARLGHAGHSVIIGSRDQARAEECAAQIAARCDGKVEGDELRGVRPRGGTGDPDRSFCQPARCSRPGEEALAGKILVDATVPLVPPKVARVQLPEEDSAAVAAQLFLGEDVSVVSAFQNVSAHHLGESRPPDRLRRHRYRRQIGGPRDGHIADRGLRTERLARWPARQFERRRSMTSVLIFINKHYRVDRAGICITGA